MESIKREDAKSMVGKGWSKIIDSLYDKLPDVYVYQVKEKFGGLRFYTDGLTEEEDTIVDEACELSEKTCEICGEEGKIIDFGHWYECRCPEHAKKL
jgi:hypothetical protein